MNTSYRNGSLVLALAMLAVATASHVWGNAGPNTGPPSKQEPSTANPVPLPDECPCEETYLLDPFDPPVIQRFDRPVDPVVLSGGKLYYPKTDVIIGGLGRMYGLNLHFFRSYCSRDNRVGALGAGWFSNLDIFLDNAGGSVPIFNDETGRQIFFTQSSSMTFADGHTGAGWHDVGYTLEAVSGNHYELIEKRGLRYVFSSVGQLEQLNDPLGHQLTYTRNGFGQVSSITDSSSQSLSFTYNSGGFLTSVTDPLGRVWGYGYHGGGVWGAGMLRGVAGPASLSLTEYYYYAADGNMLSIKNPRGYVTTYDHDWAMDRVTKMTHPDSTNVEFTYNISLGTSSMEDEDGNTWLYEYVGGLVSLATAPDNGVHQYFYNSAQELTEYRGPLYNATTAPNRKVLYTWNSDHNLTGITDETGADKAFTYHSTNHELLEEVYDNNGEDNDNTITFAVDSYRRVTTVTDACGEPTTYAYDSTTGLIETITDRRSKVTTFNYDSHGNCTSVVDAMPTPQTWTFTYDAAGRRLTRSTPISGQTVTYTYDVADRVTRITDEMGEHWDYTYDENGNRLTESTPVANTTTTYTYDTRDRLWTVTDPLSNTTTYAYNGRGLMTSVTDPLSNTTSYAYDSVGRRTQITQPGSIVTAMAYNLAGELTSVTDALSHTTSFTWSPSSRRKTVTFPDYNQESADFDEAGNVISFTNRSGTTIAKEYNQNNWLTVQSCTTCGASFSYDLEGNLTQVVDANAGTYSWTYDNMNRVLTSVQPGGTSGGSKTVTYTYDNAGRPSTLTYPNGAVATYSRDPAGRMTDLAANSTGGSGTYTIGYDDAGRRNSLTFPNSYSGAYTYDGDRLDGITWSDTTPTTLASNTYGFDDASNITSVSSSNGLSGSRSYTYDALNRLYTRSTSGSLNSPYGSLTWNLDSVGNRTTVVGGSTTTYTLNSSYLNQYSSVTGIGTSITYDQRGNLTADATRTLSYDSDNHLTQAVVGGTTVDYTYDFAHRLAKRAVGGAAVRYIYDQQWNVIAELDGSNGNTTVNYLHGPAVDDVLAEVRSSGSQVDYLFKDNLGSTVATFRPGTGIGQRYTYDEYGTVQVRDASGNASGAAPTTRYLFTGREFDVSSGLYYYRHRWYHPGIGGFVSPDPIGFEGGSANLYSYVHATPLLLSDPMGLISDMNGNSCVELNVIEMKASEPAGFPLIALWSCAPLGRVARLAAGPRTLYHFTSAANYTNIMRTGVILRNTGWFGTGVYASAFRSAALARIMGARSVERCIEIAAEGLPRVPTLIPGAYRILRNVTRGYWR